MQKVAGESLTSVILTTWQHCEMHVLFYIIRLRKKRMCMKFKDSYLSCSRAVLSITNKPNFLTRQAMQPTHKHNIEVRAPNHCCRGKAIIIAYSECVSVALFIQHAKRMRRIILSTVVCLSLPYFSALSCIRHDLGGGGGYFIKKIFYFFFSIFFFKIFFF